MNKTNKGIQVPPAFMQIANVESKGLFIYLEVITLTSLFCFKENIFE